MAYTRGLVTFLGVLDYVFKDLIVIYFENLKQTKIYAYAQHKYKILGSTVMGMGIGMGTIRWT